MMNVLVATSKRCSSQSVWQRISRALGASAALGAKVGSGSGSGSGADLDLRVFLTGVAGETGVTVLAAATGDATLRATGDAATGEAGGMGESLHAPNQPIRRAQRKGEEKGKRLA